MADNGVLPTEAFVKKIPNPSGSGVAYFKATAPSLANTPKMSTFRKQKKINDLTPKPAPRPSPHRQLQVQNASYWWAICVILVRNMWHITPQFASFHMPGDHL